MRLRTNVFVICSPHPRAGTTMFARLLADYYHYTNRTFVGFDTDPHEAQFANYFPQHTIVTDLATIQGQITLFDSLLLADGQTRIVDVWSRAWRPFFDIAVTADFFSEARRRDVTPIVFFGADGSESSLAVAQHLKSQWPEIAMAVVGNEGAAPIGQGALDHLARYPADYTFEIKALDPVVQRVVSDPGFSFARFLTNPQLDMSIVIRAALRGWLMPVFQQFQSFELRLTLQDSEYFG